MAVKTIILEIDVEDGEEATVKELLAYLSHTKKIRKCLWKEKEALTLAKPAAPAVNKGHDPNHSTQAKKAEAEKKAPISPMVEALAQQLQTWKSQDKLVRLKVVKGRGKILDIACKILGQDDSEGMVTVYDVDRKVVEKVRVTEIEDINLAL